LLYESGGVVGSCSVLCPGGERRGNQANYMNSHCFLLPARFSESELMSSIAHQILQQYLSKYFKFDI